MFYSSALVSFFRLPTIATLPKQTIKKQQLACTHNFSVNDLSFWQEFFSRFANWKCFDFCFISLMIPHILKRFFFFLYDHTDQEAHLGRHFAFSPRRTQKWFSSPCYYRTQLREEHCSWAHWLWVGWIMWNGKAVSSCKWQWPSSRACARRWNLQSRAGPAFVCYREQLKLCEDCCVNGAEVLGATKKQFPFIWYFMFTAPAEL